MSREAMKQALEALEDANDVARMEFSDEDYYSEAINALRQALVDDVNTSQERVDEKVKTEHDKQIEIAQAYERGWNAALAQQEPVAWMTHTNDLQPLFHKTRASALNWQTQPTPLYAAPPKREWFGLGEDEIFSILENLQTIYNRPPTEDSRIIFARAIEAKLKEKNT